MDIPSRVKIEFSLRKGAVYFIEDLVEGPHYFAVVTRTDDHIGILLCATSQIGKAQLRAAKLDFPPETIVIVKYGEFGVFDRDTAFDCNSALEVTPQSLIEKLDEGKLKIITSKLPDEIVKRLIDGVKASPRTEERIKKNL